MAIFDSTKALTDMTWKAKNIVITVLFFSSVLAYSQEVKVNEIPLLVAVEQEGILIDAVDNTVRMKKAPFTLVFFLEMEDYVHVNISSNAVVYNQARDGKSMAEILEQDGRWMGGAEMPSNPRKFVDIKVDETSWQGWYYFGEEGHSFNRVSPQVDFYVCYRTVENYTTDYVDMRAIESLPANELFLVFTHLEISNEWTVFTEIKSVYLKILFEL